MIRCPKLSEELAPSQLQRSADELRCPMVMAPGRLEERQGPFSGAGGSSAIGLLLYLFSLRLYLRTGPSSRCFPASCALINVRHGQCTILSLGGHVHRPQCKGGHIPRHQELRLVTGSFNPQQVTNRTSPGETLPSASATSPIPYLLLSSRNPDIII